MVTFLGPLAVVVSENEHASRKKPEKKIKFFLLCLVSAPVVARLGSARTRVHHYQSVTASRAITHKTVVEDRHIALAYDTRPVTDPACPLGSSVQEDAPAGTAAAVGEKAVTLLSLAAVPGTVNGCFAAGLVATGAGGRAGAVVNNKSMDAAGASCSSKSNGGR